VFVCHGQKVLLSSAGTRIQQQQQQQQQQQTKSELHTIKRCEIKPTNDN